MPGGAGKPAEPPVWNLANILTMLRIVMVPAFFVLLLWDDGSDAALRLIAFCVFLVAIITDRLDGEIARKYNLITNFGKIADPIADKALLGAGLIGLSIIDVIYWWVTVVILVREVGITLLRFAVIRHGVMPASSGGKLKTVLQSCAVGLFVLPVEAWFGHPTSTIVLIVAWIVMAAALIVTVVTGIDYCIKAARLRAGSELTASRRARRRGGDGGTAR